MKRFSMVNRLHSHYKWQKFFSLLVTDMLAVALVLVTWALTMESTVDGGITKTLHRRVLWENPEWLDWQGLTYQITVHGGRIHSFDMAPVMSMVCMGVTVVVILQFLLFLWETAADKHTIRRILRPLDDIAMTAERLSGREMTDEQALFSDDGEKSSLNALADALNHIEDLTKEPHITVQERELASLEAAVNNMLRRLAQSQKRQIRFVDDASHELRTPIAVIQGYIGMLDRWGKEDPKVMEEAIGAIKSEAEHMKTLVDQLLFLARGESDRLPLHRETINGCEILRELWEEYRMIDPSHQYILHLPTTNETPADQLPVTQDRTMAEEMPPSESETLPLWLRADMALLKQSLRTMLDNAWKFTPSGGMITLLARRTPVGEVVLEIADSGPGIPSEDLPRIFDRFWRGQTARAAVAGSGLGLSIAKWIVERHGGRIDAASAPGLGLRIGVVMGEAEKR